MKVWCRLKIKVFIYMFNPFMTSGRELKYAIFFSRTVLVANNVSLLNTVLFYSSSDINMMMVGDPSVAKSQLFLCHGNRRSSY